MDKTWNSGEPYQKWPVYQNYSDYRSTGHSAVLRKTKYALTTPLRIKRVSYI